MNKLSRTDECVTIGRCRISRLLFADDLVLPASSKSGFQHALNGFATACNIAGKKVSSFKIEVLLVYFSLSPVPMFSACWRIIIEIKVQVSWVAFTSDGKQDEELNVRSGKARAVMQALHHSVVQKRQLMRKEKLLVYKSIFVPIFTDVFNF